MTSQTKSATVELEDHPGIEYAVTIIQRPSETWALSRVAITASENHIVTVRDLRPSVERLVYNVLYGTDMMRRKNGEPPQQEFDWMDEAPKNLLLRNGIRTMAMLADMTDEQLLKFENMGPIRVRKLRAGITTWQAQCAQQMSATTTTEKASAEGEVVGPFGESYICTGRS
ncbi:hypothetical protein ACWDYH_38380 [Nocardia goodfellowii]